MKASQYFGRWIVMLGVAMPATAVIFAISGLLMGRTSGPGDAFGGAFLLVYVWGALTASVVSLVHSKLTSMLRIAAKSRSALLGLILGLAAGAVTPTMFTGLLDPVATGLGGLTGFMYGFVVEAVPMSRVDPAHEAEARVR